MIQRHVVADLSGLADDRAKAVIDEETPADLRARMDLDARREAGDVAHESAQPLEAVGPERMRDPVHPHRMEPGIEQNDLPYGARPDPGRTPPECHDEGLRSCSHLFMVGRHALVGDAASHRLSFKVREEHRAEVALTVGRNDDHDALARVLRPERQLHRSVDGRAGADADQQAPLRGSRRAMSKASSLVTLTISSIRPASRTAGTKPAPMPWILWGPVRRPTARANRPAPLPRCAAPAAAPARPGPRP